jgi:sugar (pentulose or hexulose) kinase
MMPRALLVKGAADDEPLVARLVGQSGLRSCISHRNLASTRPAHKHVRAAAHLGLPEGLPVAQGGADAFIGVIGLGVIAPGDMAMLTGSSHLHIGMTDRPLSGKGMFGSYRGALLPGVHVVEGGQVGSRARGLHGWSHGRGR